MFPFFRGGLLGRSGNSINNNNLLLNFRGRNLHRFRGHQRPQTRPRKNYQRYQSWPKRPLSHKRCKMLENDPGSAPETCKVKWS